MIQLAQDGIQSCGIQSSVSIKFWTFRDVLGACQLLEEDSALYNDLLRTCTFLGWGKQETNLDFLSGSDLVIGKYRAESFVVSSFGPRDGSLLPHNLSVSYHLQ